jgi:hypothetical protein
MARTVLFLKSFSRDLDRAKLLVDSVRAHNRAALGLVVIIPKAERALFTNRIGGQDVTYLDEESFAGAQNATRGWIKQQLIKFEFHRLNMAENYVVLDSDDTFIRDFDESEFVASDGRPYFVMSEAKERSRWALKLLKSDGEFAQMFRQVREQKKTIQSAFGRTGKMYYFQPAPIFNSPLLKEFDADLAKGNLTFEKLLLQSPFEADWIGEWIAKLRIHRVHPCEPLFLELQRSQLIEFEKRQGIGISELAEWYVGIRLCAGWNDLTTWS